MAAYKTQNPKTKKSGGCHCKEEPPAPCSCCEIVCFDRPEYHCGHLLSSEDLTLQLRYDIEKNKLRNRTLFGCGVVCGLRLTCDHDCCGAIRISEGYAIDGCGNDLVVCDCARFNVIERLREKDMIECPPPRKHPCDEDEERKDECPDKRCFYIVACYSEEEDVFETPFQAGCDPKPAACVATRVHERVCFDVVTKPPHCGCHKGDRFQPLPPHLKRLEEGPVGEYMQKKLVLMTGALGGLGDRADTCEVLCNLIKLFRQHLKEYPAEYNCDLQCELEKIRCPKEDSQDFANEMKAAMTALLNLLHRYSSDAALGNLVFDCCEPEEPGCVVLGAVYVENGKLRRVCNTPRQYILTFTNFWKVVHFELMQEALQDLAEKQHEGKEDKCCPELTFDGELLGRRIAYSRYAMSKSVSAFPAAIDALARSAALSFSFPDAANFAVGEVTPQKLRELNLSIRKEGTLEPSLASMIERDPTASFIRHAMVRDADNVVAYGLSKTDNELFMRDMGVPMGVIPPEDPPPSNAIKALNDRLTEREKQIEQLTASLDEVRRRLDASEQKPDASSEEKSPKGKKS